MTAPTNKLDVGAMMTDEQIRKIFMAHGFTIKEGQTDLKPYVYAAARALLSASKPAAIDKQEAVATLHDDGHWTWKGTPPYESNYAGWRMDVYAAPLGKDESMPVAPQCMHMNEPKACYRVRCQLGNKCVDDDMSPRPAAQASAGVAMFEDMLRRSLPTVAIIWPDAIPRVARECAALAASPAAPDAHWISKATELFDACKLWPESSGEGFMALLKLRNHVGDLLATSPAAPAQSAQSVTWRDAIKSYPSPDMTLAPQPSPTAVVLDDERIRDVWIDHHKDGREVDPVGFARKLLKARAAFPQPVEQTERALTDEQPEPRYRVMKASGSRYAYVIDTVEGGSKGRYDVLKGDGWTKADKHAATLNAAQPASGENHE